MALPTDGGTGRSSTGTVTPDRILQGRPGGAGTPLPYRKRRYNPFGRWQTPRSVKKTERIVRQSVQKQRVQRSLREAADVVLPTLRQAMQKREEQRAAQEEKRWQREAIAGAREDDPLNLKALADRRREAEKRRLIHTPGSRPQAIGEGILNERNEEQEHSARLRQWERQRRQQEKEQAMRIIEHQMQREGRADESLRQAIDKYGPPDEYGTFRTEEKLSFAEYQNISKQLEDRRIARTGNNEVRQTSAKKPGTLFGEAAQAIGLGGIISSSKVSSENKAPVYEIPDTPQFRALRDGLKADGYDNEKTEEVLQLTARRAEIFDDLFSAYINKYGVMPSKSTLVKMDEKVNKTVLAEYGEEYLAALETADDAQLKGEIKDPLTKAQLKTGESILAGFDASDKYVASPISRFVMPKLGTVFGKGIAGGIEEAIYQSSAGEIDVRGDASDKIYGAFNSQEAEEIGALMFDPTNLLFFLPAVGPAMKLWQGGNKSRAIFMLTSELFGPTGLEPALFNKTVQSFRLVARGGRAALKNVDAAVKRQPGFQRIVAYMTSPDRADRIRQASDLADKARVARALENGETVPNRLKALEASVQREAAAQPMARSELDEAIQVEEAKLWEETKASSPIKTMAKGKYGEVAKNAHYETLGVPLRKAVLHQDGSITHGIEFHADADPRAEGLHLTINDAKGYMEVNTVTGVRDFSSDEWSNILEIAKKNGVDTLDLNGRYSATLDEWAAAAKSADPKASFMEAAQFRPRGTELLGEKAQEVVRFEEAASADVWRRARQRVNSKADIGPPGKVNKKGKRKVILPTAQKYKTLRHHYEAMLEAFSYAGKRGGKFKAGDRVLSTSGHYKDEPLEILKDNKNGTYRIRTLDGETFELMPEELIQHLEATAAEEVATVAAEFGKVTRKRAEKIGTLQKKADKLLKARQSTDAAGKRAIGTMTQEEADTLIEIRELQRMQDEVRGFTVNMHKGGPLATKPKRDEYRKTLVKAADDAFQARYDPGTAPMDIPGVKTVVEEAVEKGKNAAVDKVAKAAGSKVNDAQLSKAKSIYRRVLNILPPGAHTFLVDGQGIRVTMPKIRVVDSLPNGDYAHHIPGTGYKWVKDGTTLPKYVRGATKVWDEGEIRIAAEVLDKPGVAEKVMAHELGHHIYQHLPSKMTAKIRKFHGGRPLANLFEALGYTNVSWTGSFDEHWATLFAIHGSKNGRKLLYNAFGAATEQRAMGKELLNIMDEIFNGLAKSSAMDDLASAAARNPKYLNNEAAIKAAQRTLKLFDEAAKGLDDVKSEAAKVKAYQTAAENLKKDLENFPRTEPPKSDEADPIGELMDELAGVPDDPTGFMVYENFEELADFQKQLVDARQRQVIALARKRLMTSEYKEGRITKKKLDKAAEEFEEARKATATAKRFLKNAADKVGLEDMLTRARKAMINDGRTEAERAQDLSLLEATFKQTKAQLDGIAYSVVSKTGARQWYHKMRELVSGVVDGPIGQIWAEKLMYKEALARVYERKVTALSKKLDKVESLINKKGPRGIKLNNAGREALQTLPDHQLVVALEKRNLAKLLIQHPEYFDNVFSVVNEDIAKAINEMQVYQNNRMRILDALGYKPEWHDEAYLEMLWDIPRNVLEARRLARMPGKVGIAKSRPYSDIIEGLKAGYKPADISVGDTLKITSNQFDDAMTDLVERQQIVKRYARRMAPGERAAGLPPDLQEFDSALYRGFAAPRLIVNQVDRMRDPAQIPALTGLNDFTGAIKNSVFGLFDFGVVGVQFLKAVAYGNLKIGFSLMNRSMALARLPHFNLVQMMDMRNLEKTVAYSAAGVHQGLDTSALHLAAGDRAQTLLKYIPVVGKTLDDKIGSAVTKSARIQFGNMLTPVRNMVFEGNLIQLALLKQDIADPKVIRTAADNANAITGASRGAMFKTRQSFERIALTSIQMTRAEMATLTQIAKSIVFPPVITNVSAAERIVGLTTLASSLLMVFGIAKAVADMTGGISPMEQVMKKADDKSWTEALLGGDWAYIKYADFKIPVIPSRGLIRAMGKSLIALGASDEMFQAAFQGDVDTVLAEIRSMSPEDLGISWAQFIQSKMAPAWQFIPATAGFGWSPEGFYSPGPFAETGEGLDFGERVLASLPIAPAIMPAVKAKITGEDFELLDPQRAFNFFGFNTIPVGTAEKRHNDVTRWAMDNNVKLEDGEYPKKYSELDFAQKEKYDQTEAGKKYKEQIDEENDRRGDTLNRLFDHNETDKEQRETELVEASKLIDWGRPGGGDQYRAAVKEINNRHSDNFEEAAELLGVDLNDFPEAANTNDRLRDKLFTLEPTDYLTPDGTGVDWDAYKQAKEDIIDQMTPDAQKAIRENRFDYGNEDLNKVERRRAQANDDLQKWIDAPKYVGISKEEEPKVKEVTDLVDKVRAMFELQTGKRAPARKKILAWMYQNGVGGKKFVATALMLSIDALAPMVKTTIRRDLLMGNPEKGIRGNPDLAVFYDFTFFRLTEEEKEEWMARYQLRQASTVYGNFADNMTGDYTRLGGDDDITSEPDTPIAALSGYL